MGGWMDGWMEVKAVLRIAYSNKKSMQTSKLKKTQAQQMFKIQTVEYSFF